MKSKQFINCIYSVLKQKGCFLCKNMEYNKSKINGFCFKNEITKFCRNQSCLLSPNIGSKIDENTVFKCKYFIVYEDSWFETRVEFILKEGLII